MSNDPIPGIDAALPIALLPVRLETRFRDDQRGLSLLVRIYPDDVHIDDHEPVLTQDEIDAGRAYWATSAAGRAADAWLALAAACGVHRAWRVRETTRPDAAGNPPQLTARPPGTARPSVARGLPERFVVRVRVGRTVLTVEGAPVTDPLQVGVDMAHVDPSARIEAGTVILAEGMRWMTEFDRAVLAGMAVEVGLPPGTPYVDEVVVTGVRPMPSDQAAELVRTLVTHHRSVDGAAFVAAGTPTNNLADTASGYTTRPDPGSADPATIVSAGESSNAATLAGALGLDPAVFATLDGAAETEDGEQATMQRALFEATWGPYLRQQATPAFRPRDLPQVYRHVTGFLRPGGPMPAVRLGRQPYGVLPIQPAGWHPSPSDDGFVTWLGGYLQRIRQLWLAGLVDVSSGLATYTHEAVSTGVRVRTMNAQSSVPAWLIGLDDNDPTVQERRLAAELGLGDQLPHVLLNLFRDDPARLWLPMADEHDTEVNLLGDPKPKEAKSVLGLLLRNAALQVMSGMAEEYAQRFAGVLDDSLVGYLAREVPTATLDLPETVVGTTRAFTRTRLAPLIDQLEQVGRAVDGSDVTVSEGIGRLIADPGPVNVGRYLFSDALRAFNAALGDVARIPLERRARLVGEVLDSASHRYDAWVTSLATKRLHELRAERPDGLQVGAWGYVHGIARRDPGAGSRGFVPAPSMRHATAAGIVRAAWVAHGGAPADPMAPFATDLSSVRSRQALALATGMRNGQQLGALLGYQIERHLHDASGGGVEVDWVIYELRRRYPLRVSTGESTETKSERLVIDGWQLVQAELALPGSVASGVVADSPNAVAEQPVVQNAVAEAVAALDALADLGLGESVYQFVGRGYDRASAATDMIGRAAPPPDRFDVLSTPRGSVGIDQRLVISFGQAVRPEGWAASTPRALLAPDADAFVASRLGPATGVVVRLLETSGAEAGRCTLDELGLAALDLAADAAAPEPLGLVLARARQVTGASTATAVAAEPGTDDGLTDLCEHAAAWHRALAGRRPVDDGTFTNRGELAEVPGSPGALAVVHQLAAQLGAAVPDTLPLWGIFVPPAQAAGQVEARLTEAAAATDPAAAARALFGSDTVVTGAAAVPSDVADALADQPGLGTGPGVVGGWLADTARVRSAAAALDEALFQDALADRPAPPLRAGQSPLAPYADGTPPAAARRWVGARFPGPLGRAPVLSAVVVGELDAGQVVGLELDAWSEQVPNPTGSAAVAANLSAPDARPPNAVLLAVPAVPGQAWTQDLLFSVIDEAVSLTRCRLVDLDATKRVPRLLPACYIADYEEPRTWVDVVGELRPRLDRYVGRNLHG